MAGNRPKGYIEWQPQPQVLDVVRNAQAVLREYRSYGPMTVRQIFYRLVGQYGYDKTERAYKRLAEYLVRARRAQMISFADIRDDGGTTQGGGRGYAGLEEFLDDLADYAVSYNLDVMQGQPYALELWCEAEGMVPMLAQMTRQWGIPVTGTGGFSSVTVTHAFAQRVLSRDVPTVLLHVGDHDPSGDSIFTSMSQDIGAFVVGALGGQWRPGTGETLLHEDNDGPDFRPRRVALTAEQVEEYDLPTAPPKASDSRSARWLGETTQAEAMPPDLLADVVQSAVREYLDENRIAELEAQEEQERDLVGDRVRDAINAVREEIDDEREGE